MSSRRLSVAVRDKPALWERAKQEASRIFPVHSARKMQWAVRWYKDHGGGYVGKKRKDNSLHIWTREDWGTRSGRRSQDTGERYLPRKVREGLSPREYQETSRVKRQSRKQWSPQPKKIAQKTSHLRRKLDRELLKNKK